VGGVSRGDGPGDACSEAQAIDVCWRPSALMPTETTVTRCGNCGASLDPRPGQAALECSYCRQTTFLAPTVTATATAGPAADDRSSLHQRLLRGPSGASHGAGARYAPAQMAGRDVYAPERGLWPVGAHASSTYGGSWSPSALLGPPRI
jgi:DNA-directed RNA polymerase subunit RPC12/RpoP